jgi:hypothetical protein
VLQAHDAAAVRDTVAAVFRAAEFERGRPPSLVARLVAWVVDAIREWRLAAPESPLLYRLALGTALALALAVVARAAWLAWARRTVEGPRRRATRRAGRAAADPWLEAQALAAGGDYTAAAHHLHAAILDAAAGRGLVRPHPSKTIGDYLRELRARAAQAIVAPYRDFARAYEVVVFGDAACDRERYERLRALAAAIVARDA